MNENPRADQQVCRPYWQNCGVEADAEILAIDRMEDAIAPADEHTAQIRSLITRFEACYHEADKEALRIVKAIGTGRCPKQSNARPPKRKKELENSRRILSHWCQDPGASALNLHVGGIPADELLAFIGQATPLKTWQVQRLVDKVTAALDSSRPYHNLVLDVGDYGEPGTAPAGEHHKNNAAFLEQTRKTSIQDSVEGRQAKISLAMAIDLLMPCHWDFVGGLVTILKAIGGDLYPQRPYACCSRNLQMSPLCEKLKTTSNALRAYWADEKPTGSVDSKVPASLGAPTPAKRWLAASLDKTIRLHLKHASDYWLKLM
ncbi:MAG TPA: hypothetical protein VMW24_08225 [Sedimentisphaerales bacterium]|nr:hypothetical protein [Sedimentisphaerales bacterium]